MAKYLVTWKANASAWPTDPKQALAIVEGVLAGGDQIAASGAEMGMFTPQEGYSIVEADSKATVLRMVNAFFPLYTQEIREIVPWDAARAALLDSARMAAGA